MSNVAFTMNDISGVVNAAFIASHVGNNDAMFSIVVRAATYAMRDAAALLKSEGRANIAAGGFGKKWQSAWQTKAYPEKRFSINAAAWGVQKISYAEIFQSGGVIRPSHSRYLWIPFKATPKVGRKKATPALLAGAGVKLFQIKRAGKPPLLATKAMMTGRAKASGKITLARIKKGLSGKGVEATIPLFFGVPSVTMKKRFDLDAVAEAVRARVPELYMSHVEGV